MLRRSTQLYRCRWPSTHTGRRGLECGTGGSGTRTFCRFARCARNEAVARSTRGLVARSWVRFLRSREGGTQLLEVIANRVDGGGALDVALASKPHRLQRRDVIGQDVG